MYWTTTNSMRAFAAVAWLAATLPPTAPAQDAATPAKATPAPGISFGRATITDVTVVQGSAAVRNVALHNRTDAPVRLTAVQRSGDAFGLTLVRDLQRFPVTPEAPLEMELPAQSQVRFELYFDAKDAPLGDRTAKLIATVDGKPFDLAVRWEVIEPPKDGADDLPIPKPKSDWEQYATNGPPPRLECDRWSHDFGRRMSGERLETEFKLRNTGEGDLVIIKVGAQCHCTLSELILPGRSVDPKELKLKEAYGTLKTGEEATLKCTVDTAGMGGTTHKKIQIYTNDRTRSPVSIDLTMVVDNPFSFSPSSINFGNVRAGEPTERVVRMASLDQGSFAIVGHDLPQPEVMHIEYAEVKPRKNEQCAWELKLKLRDGLECKDHFGRIKLALEHERIKTIDQLHYTLRVLPDVEWTIDNRSKPDSPESILLGVVKPGVNDVRTIVFENKNRAVPWRLTSATVSSRIGSEPFATEITTLEEGQRYEVKLKVVSAPKSKSFAGDLVIAADSKTVPQLKLKFSGIWSGNVGPTPATAPAPATATNGG